MKMVIEIPKETANAIKDNAMFGVIPNEILWDVTSAIVNGKPLPKGHGDLIDRKVLMDRCVTYLESSGATTNLIKSAMTIIEADKEGAEE